MRATPSKGLEKNNTRAQAARAAKGGSSLGSESLMAHQKRKIRTPFGFFFLSKPQAWHIIAAQRAVHIISPCGAVSHHALACIFLRLDDIQTFGLMIYRRQAADDIHASRRDWVRRASKSRSKAELPYLHSKYYLRYTVSIVFTACYF